MPSATLVAVVAALALAAVRFFWFGEEGRRGPQLRTHPPNNPHTPQPVTASDAVASNAVAAVKSYLDNLKTGLAADAALKPSLTFNASAPKPPLITPGVGTTKPGAVIKDLTLTPIQGWKIELSEWVESAHQELQAAKAKAEALALAASYKNGTLADIAVASLQLAKAEAVDQVRERMLAHLDSKINFFPNTLDTLTAAANDALDAWNDASSGGLKAQIHAAKLAVAAFVGAKTKCELQSCIDQARALGLLPLPLAAVESYVPGGVPLLVNSDGSGVVPQATGLGRRRRRLLLHAFEPRRGRTLLQATPTAAVQLEALESTLAKRALPSCCAAGATVSQDAALAEVKRYLSGVAIKFDVDAVPLTESELLTAARGYFFSCKPAVSLSVIEDNLPNVQLVMRLLPYSNTAAKIDWVRSTRTLYALNGPAPDYGRALGPAPTASGPLTQTPTAQQLYTNFLQTVGRYPFFCGEQSRDSDGSVLSLLDTCRRELAFAFAKWRRRWGLGRSGRGSGPTTWAKASTSPPPNNCSRPRGRAGTTASATQPGRHTTRRGVSATTRGRGERANRAASACRAPARPTTMAVAGTRQATRSTTFRWGWRPRRAISCSLWGAPTCWVGRRLTR